MQSTTTSTGETQTSLSSSYAPHGLDHDAHAPVPDRQRADTLSESLATGVALVVCVVARLPHRLLDAFAVEGWVAELVVVVAVMCGARGLARAPFSLARAAGFRSWARNEAKVFVVTAAVGSALTVPLYGLLRATPAWWVLAWALFAVVTLVGQVVTPFTVRAQSGPLTPAEPALAERVRHLGALAGVDVGGDVCVAGKAGSRRCNAYVLGLGPTRRVVLEQGVAAWPPELVDQVVAHEIGHWRLGHGARRLPLSIAAQLATFAVAAWALSFGPLLAWAGISSAGDPRGYPLLLLLTPLLALPARCLLAWRDRAQERAADEFALTLLHAPRDFAAMLERAAGQGGATRRLPWWRRLTASHPPIDERALACTRFASTA